MQGLQGYGPHVHSHSLTLTQPTYVHVHACSRPCTFLQFMQPRTARRTTHPRLFCPLPPTPSFPPKKEREREGITQREEEHTPPLACRLVIYIHLMYILSHRPHDLTPTQLGIPTANLPVDATVTPWISDAKSGVYFGWAALELGKDHPNYKAPSSSSPPAGKSESGENKGGFSIFPMVMSIGYNPFYNNTVRSAEVHVLDKFAADFYGVNMRLLIVGYIRDEKNYEGLEALIEDINTDCEVARRSLEREAWKLAGQQGGTLDASWLTR